MVSFSLRLRISYLLLQDSSPVSFHLIQFEVSRAANQRLAERRDAVLASLAYATWRKTTKRRKATRFRDRANGREQERLDAAVELAVVRSITRTARQKLAATAVIYATFRRRSPFSLETAENRGRYSARDERFSRLTLALESASRQIALSSESSQPTNVRITPNLA